MIGIKRLRTLAGTSPSRTLGGALAEIADQIERELREERERWDDDLSEAQVSWTAVAGVYLDMERHVLGHEGMEDSPVARWARELRGAMGATMSRHESDAVAGSPCDGLSEEDRDAIAWVRDHGGLDHVKAEWRSRSNLKRMYEKEKAKVERQQRHIEFVQGKCRERQGHIVDLNKMVDEMRPRLMPEGYEWPRYESGDLVMFGDYVENRNGTCTVNSVRFYSGGGVTVYGEDRGAQFVVVTEPVMRDPIRKARPKVFAADGEPLEVGQTVWDVLGNRRFKVIGFGSDPKLGEFTVKTVGIDGMSLEGYSKPSDLTHQRPVLDADGVPIRVGDEMYGTVEGGPFIVTEVSDKGSVFVDAFPDMGMHGSMLTHTKPETDSWERIEEDADALVDAEINGEGSYNAANAYCNRRGLGEGTSFVLMAQDPVRRCRALAERERGE